MRFEDEARPAVLRAAVSAMRERDGLFDPAFLGRIAAESGVEIAVITYRWGNGPSVVADVLSEHGLASPGWPDNDKFDSASVRSVLGALAEGLTEVLDDGQLTRAALSQAVASPLARQVWAGFVKENLDQWTAILCDAQGPRAPIERERAAQAVTVVASLCYSRMLFGDSVPPIPNAQVIEIAMSTMESDGNTSN